MEKGKWKKEKGNEKNTCLYFVCIYKNNINI